MYVPQHFAAESPAALASLIDAFPFATLITTGPHGAFEANHIPIIVEDPAAPQLKLLGHVARANPMWHTLERSPTALAIFHGPHAYISPRFYSSNDRIPTWNYAVAHVRGHVRLIHDAQKLEDIIIQFMEKFEGESLGRPHVKMEDDYPQRLLQGIVGFEILAQEVTGKFKLGQNRRPADRQSAADALAREGDEQGRQIGEWMKRIP